MNGDVKKRYTMGKRNFMGEAPEFGETIKNTFYDNVFSGCTGNAYYIEDSGTWTDEVLSGHGGTIEWSAWKGDVTSEDENDNEMENIPKKDKDDAETEDVTEYYDQTTGITLCVKDEKRKTAVLTSIDKKHTKKTMRIPNTVILDGISYTITEIGKKAKIKK